LAVDEADSSCGIACGIGCELRNRQLLGSCSRFPDCPCIDTVSVSDYSNVGFHRFVIADFGFNHFINQKNMKEFEVKTRFIFEGVFKVKAETRQQAAEYVQKHCGLVIGGDIHSTLPDDDIDWDFNVHPEKEIKGIKQTSK